MSDLRDLYQEVIIDHGRHPRNFGVLENANHIKQGFNPLCGDKITLYIEEKNGVIENIMFNGCGCAISMASASLMTESLKNKKIAEADMLFSVFHQLITHSAMNENQQEILGKLTILKGVSEFPARVKCATLAWHTLNAALHNESGAVTTEESL